MGESPDDPAQKAAKERTHSIMLFVLLS